MEEEKPTSVVGRANGYERPFDSDCQETACNQVDLDGCIGKRRGRQVDGYRYWPIWCLVNAALALQQAGKKVGILDADIHGPTIPRMFNLSKERMEMDNSGLLVPLSNYGISVASMAFLQREESDATAWRGLMVALFLIVQVMKALQDLIHRVKWPAMDILLIDMPPGTGDAYLTVGQQLVIDGALVVSTPHAVAVAAARKSITLLQKQRIPLVGIVGNMCGWRCDGCTKEHLLRLDYIQRMSEETRVPLCANLPTSAEIAEGGDAGKPDCIHRPSLYASLAQTVVKFLSVQEDVLFVQKDEGVSDGVVGRV